MYFKSVILLITCLIIPKSMAGSEGKEAIQAVFRDIEYSGIHIVLSNCTRNMESMLMNFQTVSPIAHKLLPHMNLIQYAAPNITINYRFYEFRNRIMESSHFDVTLPVVIIIPGSMSSVIPSNYIYLAKALRDSKEVNVFILEQGLLANNEFMFSILSVPVVGEALGQQLAELNRNLIKHIHLIGYSLGVYTTGYVGRTYEKLTGKKLDRISGLDAARPCFDVDKPPLDRLSPDDAKFVDVMHTGMDVFGSPYESGHADFYPNGGVNQPACGILPLCSHLLSTVYFGESVRENMFVAVECKDWDTFLAGDCANNTKVKMGYRLDPKTRGRYFLKTESNMPFSMGHRGVIVS